MPMNPLSPLNDFIRHVVLEQINDTTGVLDPITTGTVTGFLSTDDGADATAYVSAWSVTGVYIGGANGFEPGTWQFTIDAADITLARCTAAFTTANPFFIVQKTSGFRVVEPLLYLEARRAVVVA